MSDPESSIDSLYSAALAHHHAGRLAEAETLYRQILESRPRQHEVLHLLGAVCAQSSRLDQAIELMRAANAVSPNVALYHSNLGKVLSDAGRLTDAVVSLQQALAIDPGFAPAFGHLGSVHIRMSQPDDAMGYFRSALALQPSNVEVRSILGMMLYKADRLSEAEAQYDTLLDYGAATAEAYQGLANIRHRQCRFDDAEMLYRHAVELAPTLIEAWCNLGGSLIELDRYDDAEEACRQALRLDPDYAPAISNLGLIALRRDLFDEAETLLRRAAALAPELELSYGNLAIALEAQARYGEAEALSREMLRRFPGSVAARNNLALTLLRTGQFAEAWPLYEARRTEPKLATAYRRPAEGVTRWSGEAAPGRLLRIHAEQGFGDMIQFCRYVTLAAQRARIVLEAPVPLIRLFTSLTGVERVIGPGEVVASDLFCPILSLPSVFDTTPDTIPATMPYLRAEPAEIEKWRRRVGALKGLKIGLAWTGNPKLPLDRQRSIDPAMLGSLLSTPGTSFVSLQKDNAGWHSKGLVDWTAELNDFADTAALIETLDLVISVDTAVVHLAGALGKPVWLLNRFVPDWRWQLGRDDSPWYPSLRQFRQNSFGDWPGVLARVIGALAALR